MRTAWLAFWILFTLGCGVHYPGAEEEAAPEETEVGGDSGPVFEGEAEPGETDERTLTIEVEDPDGTPLQNASIEVQNVNDPLAPPIVVGLTNENGKLVVDLPVGPTHFRVIYSEGERRVVTIVSVPGALDSGAAELVVGVEDEFTFQVVGGIVTNDFVFQTSDYTFVLPADTECRGADGSRLGDQDVPCSLVRQETGWNSEGEPRDSSLIYAFDLDLGEVTIDTKKFPGRKTGAHITVKDPLGLPDNQTVVCSSTRREEFGWRNWLLAEIGPGQVTGYFPESGKCGFALTVAVTAIRGVLLDANGNPLAGAKIKTKDIYEPNFVVTRPDGSFFLGNVRAVHPGTNAVQDLVLQVCPSVHDGAFVGDLPEITIPAAEVVLHGTLDLGEVAVDYTPTRGWISFVVTDCVEGETVRLENVTIELRDPLDPRDATTNEHGRAWIEDLRPSSGYAATARFPDGEEVSIVVPVVAGRLTTARFQRSNKGLGEETVVVVGLYEEDLIESTPALPVTVGEAICVDADGTRQQKVLTKPGIAVFRKVTPPATVTVSNVTEDPETGGARRSSATVVNQNGPVAVVPIAIDHTNVPPGELNATLQLTVANLAATLGAGVTGRLWLVAGPHVQGPVRDFSLAVQGIYGTEVPAKKPLMAILRTYSGGLEISVAIEVLTPLEMGERREVEIDPTWVPLEKFSLGLDFGGDRNALGSRSMLVRAPEFGVASVPLAGFWRHGETRDAAGLSAAAQDELARQGICARVLFTRDDFPNPYGTTITTQALAGLLHVPRSPLVVRGDANAPLVHCEGMSPGTPATLEMRGAHGYWRHEFIPDSASVTIDLQELGLPEELQSGQQLTLSQPAPSPADGIQKLHQPLTAFMNLRNATCVPVFLVGPPPDTAAVLTQEVIARAEEKLRELGRWVPAPEHTGEWDEVTNFWATGSLPAR